jgi:hypothetical protein
MSLALKQERSVRVRRDTAHNDTLIEKPLAQIPDDMLSRSAQRDILIALELVQRGFDSLPQVRAFQLAVRMAHCADLDLAA